MESSRCGYFPLWLLSVVATSRYGYFIFPLRLLFGGASKHGKPSAMYRGYIFQCRRNGPNGNKYWKDQAATELKLAHHDAALPPPQKKRKYQIVNQCLAQHKQEYVMGKDLY